MARRLRIAADGEPMPDRDALVRMIRRWEREGLNTSGSERYELLYATALGARPDELRKHRPATVHTATAGHLSRRGRVTLRDFAYLCNHVIEGCGLAEDDLIRMGITSPVPLGPVDVDFLAASGELQLTEQRSEVHAPQVADYAPDVLQANFWPAAQLGNHKQFHEVLEAVEPDDCAIVLPSVALSCIVNPEWIPKARRHRPGGVN
jgi:hypothetical protein